MNQDHRFRVDSLDLLGMQRLADAMLRHLPAQIVIGLCGTLGAGKTTLVQAIARAADIDAADVTSPTFTLLQTHRGTRTLHHLDAYRIVDEDEFLELGVEELFDDDAWTLIEWADRIRHVMPTDSLWIEIEVGDDSRYRSITLRTEDEAIATLAQQIAEVVLPSN